MTNTHSAQTTSEFQSFVQSSARGRMADMSPNDFISFLNEALVNRYMELRRLIPSIYSTTTTITATDSFNESLPTDFKQGQALELYTDPNSESSEALYPDAFAEIKGGVIIFPVQTTQTFTLRYHKAESQYESGDTVTETKDVQAKHVLMEEIKALYYQASAEGRETQASQTSLTKANRTS